MKEIKLMCCLVLLLLMASCEKNAIEEKPKQIKFDKTYFTENFIQLIPKTGMVLTPDTFALFKAKVSDVINRLDTNSLSVKIDYKKPVVIGIETIDSPPPGFEGEWEHTPTEYFSHYEAIIDVEGMHLTFVYGHEGQNLKPMELMKDSLVLQKIAVNKMNNVGLYPDLKIGDSFENIYKYYSKKYASYYPEEPVGGHSEVGFVMYVEIQNPEDEYYAKIKYIEINGF